MEAKALRLFDVEKAKGENPDERLYEMHDLSCDYRYPFVFLIGIHLYTLLFDVESFKKMMKFIIVSYSLTMMIYILFPNCQELRPLAFERDNIFTRFLSGFYQFDTNTNVCPSLHVTGSVAVMAAAWNSKHFHTPRWKITFGVTAGLISVSTVFPKQHSVLNVFAAVPICVLAYYVAYAKGKGEGRWKRKQSSM